MIPGHEIGIRIDQTLTQDATGTLVMLELEAMGVGGAAAVLGSLGRRDLVAGRAKAGGGRGRQDGHGGLRAWPACRPSPIGRARASRA